MIELDDFIYAFILLMLYGALSMIPAFIASNKGRSFLGWWIFSFFTFFIVALAVALLVSPDENELNKRKAAAGEIKICPQCAEKVRFEAVKCRFCGYEFRAVVTPITASDHAKAAAARAKR